MIWQLALDGLPRRIHLRRSFLKVRSAHGFSIQQLACQNALLNGPLAYIDRRQHEHGPIYTHSTLAQRLKIRQKVLTLDLVEHNKFEPKGGLRVPQIIGSE